MIVKKAVFIALVFAFCTVTLGILSYLPVFFT